MKKILRCALVTAMLAVLLVSQASAFNYWDNGYILAPDKKTRLAMPKPYTCVQVIDKVVGSETDEFNNPQDLFRANNGDYYVADTGNHRIVRLNSKFEYIGEYNNEAHEVFIDPHGVFVTDEGDMFVADISLQKVIHIDKEGEWVEDFVLPESDLLYNVEYFAPNKVAINPVNNYLYVVQGKQFMTIDAANNFKGYIGANKVEFNLFNFIIRKFASDEQKDQMNSIEPEAYYNFCIANGGKVYATGAEEQKRISIINTVGNNTYPSKEYGEKVYMADGSQVKPVFKDICVDENEFITVIEENSGCLYQYDYEGNLLCIFGGKGTTDGFFNMPSSLVYGGNGLLVTLDQAEKRIQVFKPTDFILGVQKAIKLYADGNYQESLKHWNQIKKSNASYGLAREFIGKINMKQGKYKSVLADFKQSEDRVNYGKAFEKIRYQFLQANFGWVMLLACAAIIVIVLLMKLTRKYVRKIKKEFWDKLEG